MNNSKKCKLCQKQELDFTSPGSKNKAEIFMCSVNYLNFFGDDGAYYTLACNFCPKCGRNLTNTYDK